MVTVNVDGWVASAVKREIEKANLTAKYVSDEAGIPWTTFSRRLKGFGAFTWEELMRVSQVLEVPPSCFTPPIFRQSEAA